MLDRVSSVQSRSQQSRVREIIALSGKSWNASSAVLILGAAALCFPTMLFVAQESWSTEQGAHGPIVLMTGLWLLFRLWPHARKGVRPPSWPLVAVLLTILLPLLTLSRITQIVEIEGYIAYACLLTGLYSVIGSAAMRMLWFPLLYLVFVFPPPDTVSAALTGPLKILVSRAAIDFLSLLDYPIAGRGVAIYIGQYELLVAAACSGLNSLISLSAISLFYIYLRHQAEWRYALLLVVLIVPIALLANLVRVLILILLTYHAGEAAAQGFLHNFAGILMFTVALIAIFGFDAILKPIWDGLVGRTTTAEARQEASYERA